MAAWLEGEHEPMTEGAFRAAFDEAVRLFSADRYAEAEIFARRCVEIAPDSADAWHVLGCVSLRNGNPDAAAQLVRRALDIKQDAAYLGTLAMIFKAIGNYPEAFKHLSRACELAPNDPHGWSNLALICLLTDQPEAALEACRRALSIDAAHWSAWSNAGEALRRANRLDEALACFDSALQTLPDGAFPHHRAVITCNRARVRLKLGDFTGGWADYEAFGRRIDLPRPDFPYPEWQGQEMAGRRIVLRAEAGFGDAIQFVRYADLLAARGAHPIAVVPRPLVRLCRQVTGVEDAVADDGPAPAADCWVDLMRLPYRLGTTLATIPSQVPYIRVDQDGQRSWHHRLDGVRGLRVGLCWAGGTKPAGSEEALWAARRSVSLEALSPIAGLPLVTYICLQPGATAPLELLERFPIGDFTAECKDFMDTAALIANLDLVITVDTAVAHLAGALARPTWLLTCFDGCWRWLTDRSDSPWYPTMRIYRQQQPGDWSKPVCDIVADLTRFARTSTPPDSER